LLKILTRITTPTEGTATLRGRVSSLLEVGTGFHPELTGRENVYLNGSVLGMKRREITSKFAEIVEFAGVEKFIDTPVKRYSSGMSVRLAFAVAAHLEPEILLVDEVLAVGDAEFQRRCLGRMEALSRSGRTVLFVSHQMHAVARLCDRTLLLEGGTVVRDGESEVVVAHYLQSELGAASSRSWADGTGPGRDVARLSAVRVVDETGATVDAQDSRRPVGIEIAFVVLKPRELFPKIKLTSTRGEVVFNALDTSSRWARETQPGEYTATAWIPGNLLNEGTFSVEVSVVSYATSKLHPHAGMRDALSFSIYDPGEGGSARGGYGGQLQGSVRPLLDWTYPER
jgi:lipopolysaccharide transport system ATP-binding protein